MFSWKHEAHLFIRDRNEFKVSIIMILAKVWLWSAGLQKGGWADEQIEQRKDILTVMHQILPFSSSSI